MLDRIKINEFRCFSNEELRLGKYLTVLSGRNSTGKSTVLGMLGNVGELKRKDGETYTSGQFRAEFNELFKGSQDYDQSGSEKYEIFLSDNNGENIDYRKFRVTWQKKSKYSEEKRFRIIPYKRGENGEISSKFKMPVLYLGLSRLFPIGEIENDSLESTNVKFKSDLHKEWFLENYKKILSMHEDIKDIANTTMGNIKNKKAIGVITNKYDYLTNSAGQDNLGQILLGILSFKDIKEKYSDEWIGGLLLIDEFDATLHPAAQKRLIDLLITECKKINVQVVITTHSTNLLKYITTKTEHNNKANNNIELYYFTNANRILEIKRNPDYINMESDLLVQSYMRNGSKIKVYTEDAENRWMLDNILRDYNGYLDILDVSIGCASLITLYNADPMYFGNCLIVLDGDVKDSDLDVIPKRLREKMNNILLLPGEQRPESVLYDYLIKLEPEHPYWELAAQFGYSWDYFNDNGPNSNVYKNAKERERYKSWFNDEKVGLNSTKLFDFWKKDNEKVIKKFITDFIDSYNSIASRVSVSKIDF